MDVRHEQFLNAAKLLFGSLSAEALATIEPLAEWIHLVRGDALFRQGDASDGVCVLISGRLHVVRTDSDGTRVVIGEAMPGESIGEMGFFTREPRTADVIAVRDSLVVRFSTEAFERIISLHPEIVRDLMRLQIGRLQRTSRPKHAAATSIAIVPLRMKSSFPDIVTRIAKAVGTDLHLDSAEIDRQLGAGTAQLPEHDPRSAALVAWLNQQESRQGNIVYEADPQPTEWTERCLRQADHVVLVADASEDPSPVEVERLLAASAVGPRRTLVLLHPNGDCLPSNTKKWLEARRVDDHHHVRLDRDGDFARVGRFLTGRAVGLVLGGGGARGFAHIGILRALQEAGVPVDMIGGTSMGAALAAQHAMGWPPERIEEVNRQVWVEIRPHKELTLPILSIVGNRGSTRCGQMMYGDVQIEDLWTPFFCVSSNLSTATARVHRTGSLLWSVTASASLPGVAVPVLDDGQLLVDGALLNNVPGDIMRELGCGRVMVSEVSVEQDQTFACARVPTVWEIVRNKFRWKKQPIVFPSMLEILLRAAMLASARREREIMKDADLVFHPPINQFALLDFASLHEIVRVGYEYARAELAAWRENGQLTKVLDV
ncbi:MAG TPA: cyclic nucleotide-binding and patatin-like phospholipase domain-containing protein [Thermoanaerobaculia bacterium]|nr:cyclic nucleotide-binding and patatin-like phospholipase domain-containing protein [Thermoanaerobaculia bacterium]